MAAIISEALDALLEPRESTKAIDKLLGLVADLLAGKEPQHVKAWQDAQESFDGNVASVVLHSISRTMTQVELRQGFIDAPTTAQLTKALSLLQGLLLLHPRSARLFERRQYLLILLATIRIRQPAVSPALPLTPLTASNLSFDAVPTAVTAHSALLVQAIRTLLTALVDRPRSERMFEEVGGLADVADLLKSKNTSMDVRMACLEVLYAYLAPAELAAQKIERTPSMAAISPLLQPQARRMSKTTSTDSMPRPAYSPALAETRPSTPTTPSNPFLPPPTPSRPRTSSMTPKTAPPADDRLRKMLEEADTSWAPASPRKSRASGMDAPLTRSKKRPPSLVLDSVPPPSPIFTAPPEHDTSLKASMAARRPLNGHIRRHSATPRHSGFMPSIPSMPSLATPPPRSPLAPTTTMPMQSPALGLARSRSSYGIAPPSRSSSFDPTVTSTSFTKPSLSPSRSRRSLASSTPPASPSKRLSSLVQQVTTASLILPDPPHPVSRQSSSSSASSADTPSRRASIGKPPSPLKRVSSTGPSIPSSPSKRSSLSASRPALPSSPSKRASLGVRMPGGGGQRSLEDKKTLLGRHLGDIDSLCEAFAEASVSMRV